MECPHCGSDFDSKPHTFQLGIDQDGTWQCANIRCPTCDRLIVSVRSDRGKEYPMLPPGSSRAKLSEYVPAELAAEYWTASRVLPFSEEASAAMSRRLLQRVLSWKAGAGYGGLANQVERAIASPGMPDYLKEALSTYVKLARLEAHEVKSFRCETITRVNEGEALWLLEVLKPLFEFYYVQPALVARMRLPIEERLAPAPVEDAGELEEAEGQTRDWTVVMDEPVSEAGCEPAVAQPPAKEPVR
jgi:hypothetical protein